MCKGLGRLEQSILKKTSGRPLWLTCGALAADAKVSRKSMARAMHSFVRKYPRFAVKGGNGRTHYLVLFALNQDTETQDDYRSGDLEAGVRVTRSSSSSRTTQ